jgi:hypothetical protein
VFTSNVINNHRNRRVSDITGDQTPKPLLSRRIPSLESYSSVVEVHCLGEEIDTNCRCVLGIKVVVHEASYQRSFADGLFAEEDELELA